MTYEPTQDVGDLSPSVDLEVIWLTFDQALSTSDTHGPQENQQNRGLTQKLFHWPLPTPQPKHRQPNRMLFTFDPCDSLLPQESQQSCKLTCN